MYFCVISLYVCVSTAYYIRYHIHYYYHTNRERLSNFPPRSRIRTHSHTVHETMRSSPAVVRYTNGSLSRLSAFFWFGPFAPLGRDPRFFLLLVKPVRHGRRRIRPVRRQRLRRRHSEGHVQVSTQRDFTKPTRGASVCFFLLFIFACLRVCVACVCERVVSIRPACVKLLALAYPYNIDNNDARVSRVVCMCVWVDTSSSSTSSCRVFAAIPISLRPPSNRC